MRKSIVYLLICLGVEALLLLYCCMVSGTIGDHYTRGFNYAIVTGLNEDQLEFYAKACGARLLQREYDEDGNLCGMYYTATLLYDHLSLFYNERLQAERVYCEFNQDGTVQQIYQKTYGGQYE